MAIRICSRAAVGVAILALAGTSQSATPQSISISGNDVSFYQYSFQQNSRFLNASCGFLIHGNSYHWEVPRPEWVINVSEAVDHGKPVVRVDAATFRVLSDDAKAPVETRPPITAVSFSFKGRSEPLAVSIVGQPKMPSGQVTGTLQTAPAQLLFAALYHGDPVTIWLAYQDGTSEVLEVHKWWVAKVFDPPTGMWYQTEGNYVQDCLQSLEAAPAGTQFVIYQLGPIPLTNEGGFHPKSHTAGPIGWWSPPGAYCFGRDGQAARCGVRQ